MYDQIRRHSLPLILFAAFLTVAALMLLVRLPGMINDQPKNITVEEENGIYDLTDMATRGEFTATLPLVSRTIPIHY